MTGKELVKLLEQNGWVVVRVKGSHHRMTKGELAVSVPVHGNKDLAIGTANAILKLAGLK